MVEEDGASEGQERILRQRGENQQEKLEREGESVRERERDGKERPRKDIIPSFERQI